MSGYSKIFVVGNTGFDGINPIYLQILVGNSDRQWLEPHYFDKTIQPIGKIRTIIPEKPDDSNSILDACIAFAPKFFEECPSMKAVSELLQGFDRLDFDIHKEKIPDLWYKLREEARGILQEKVGIYTANLIEHNIIKKSDDIERQILRILRVREYLTYTEVKKLCGIITSEDSGKFAYFLRKLVKESLVEESERHYNISGLGKDALKNFERNGGGQR